MSEKVIYKSDCKHFLGHIPCAPNKKYGVTCADCEYYDKKTGKILIIKLGAIGDVIRTTPLLHRIWQNRRTREVWWLTEYPSVVPAKVDKVLKMDFKSALILQNTEFDWVINLDKDYEACALTASLKANQKDGFTLVDGKPAPLNERAEHKFITGIFDSENKKNTKSYPEEIFEICGWEFKQEQYILDEKKFKWNIDNGEKKIIGLNTGCGGRWTSRLLPDKTWIELIKKLQQKGYYPLLLGGQQEHYRNDYLANATNAAYLGHFELDKFISLVGQCDLVVSAVTMGAHIAIGLRKPLVLINNIFNAKEFELYGRGEVIEPTRPCQCFFSATCTNPDYNCIDYVTADDLYKAIKRNIKGNSGTEKL
jgi:heptosyltransferase-2